MDILLWIANGFCSDGQTNGGQNYTCSIQGIPDECGVCDAPCRTEQLKINDENVPGNDLYLSAFWHPDQLDQSIDLAHQYQDQTYSAPYSGAYWRFHEQYYKPIWPRTGSYENIESNADYAASYNQFWRGESRSIGIWDTKFTAWFKRAAVGYNHLNWGVPSTPLVTDFYWERYVQLCDWVLGFEMWVCPQPARGTDAYNDIFDIWYDTRYDPWYGDADLTPVEPATWGQIKATYRSLRTPRGVFR